MDATVRRLLNLDKSKGGSLVKRQVPRENLAPICAYTWTILSKFEPFADEHPELLRKDLQAQVHESLHAGGLFEVYPDDDLEWASNDLGFFGPEGLNSVIKAGQEANISPELLKKIIDIEVEVSGLGSRRGINSKIEGILKKDWESIEEAFESKQVQSNATNEFKSKRDSFQAMLGEFS